MRDLQKYLPVGGLNLDDSVELITGGDYTDALNIRHLTETGGSEHKIHKILGNDFSYEIPDIETQNKIYRIPTEAGTDTHVLTFKTSNGDIFATATFTEDTNDVSQTQLNATNSITVALSGSIIPQTFTFTNQSDHITVELTTITGYEYFITCPTLNLIIQQEAINLSLAGKQIEIGSKEILDDLFVFNTTQDNLPENIDIDEMFVTDGILHLKTTQRHFLTTNDSIITENIVADDGSSTYDWLNGEWIVEVVDDYEVILYYQVEYGVGNTVPFSSITYGNITKHSKGIGEIGVVMYSIQTDTSTYIRLLGSKELNFNTNYQIDGDGEYSNNQARLYPTDDYNPPRAFIHDGDYSEDGSLSINGGTYLYGKVNEQIKLTLSVPKASLSFTQQHTSGGNIDCGNWRYTIRFLNESLVPTDCLDLGNPINVYSVAPSSKRQIRGDIAGTSTTKINEFEIIDIDTDLYSYIELIAINYIGQAFSGYIIRREAVVGETMTLYHKGTEAQTIDLAINVINFKANEYLKARNSSILKNRLVLSKLTVYKQLDFTNWAKTFTHSIKRKSISNVGNITNINQNIEFGEYQDPINVNYNLGLMHNETYRMGVKIRLKAGKTDLVFWVDDLKIDISNTNSANPTDNRRIAGLDDWILRYNDDVYSAYIEFSNINLDYLIDGKKVRDLISGFSFVRVECIPEVLATGMIALGVFGMIGTNIYRYGDDGTYRGEFPDISGNWAYPGGHSADRNTLFFHSPDLIYGFTSIGYRSGDKLLNIGIPINTYEQQIDNFNTDNYIYNIGEYNSMIWQNAPLENAISEIKDLYPGTEIEIGGTKCSSVYNFVHANMGYKNYTAKCLVIKTTSDMVSNMDAGYPDYGYYYCQYFREIQDKYGDKNNSIYIPTGHYYKIDENTPSIVSTDVFGGDTYTQKTYYKNRYGVDGETYKYSSGVAFYSQNRANIQMKIKELDTSPEFFPYLTKKGWLVDSDVEDEKILNAGYETAIKVQDYIAYNETLPYPMEYFTQIAYSNIKLINSFLDNYRIFEPLSFKNLDITHGEIVHHVAFNDELITFQINKLERQYFSERGSLVTKQGYEVQLGDPGVMARDGFTLSSLGCQHKWGIIKGKTETGNDIIGWINQKHKMSFKLSDRIYAISNRKVRSWFNKNLDWVTEDRPASGLGICGVWNGEHSELIWTIRGRKEASEYNNTNSYNAGDLVWVDTSDTNSSAIIINPLLYNFQQTPDLYLAKYNVPANSPFFPGSEWELIPHTNKDYYNEWTFVFSEFKDRFTTPLTPLPKIYLQWRNTYLVPSPAKHVNKVYRNNRGNLCEWFRNGDDVITDIAYLEGVINKHPDETKWYEAIKLDALPDRVEFTTQDHISFLDELEFEERENSFYSPIKENSATTGVNDGDTSLLFGKYLKIKYILKDKFFSIITKFRISPRITQK